MVQRIAPHTLPPQKTKPGNGQSPMEKNQPLPPALLLARRIRREQGVEQVRRFLAAMEPFLAPNERMAIAEQLGIRLPAPQPSGNQAPRGTSRQPESVTMPSPGMKDGHDTANARPQPSQQNSANNNFSNMAQQMQLMQMLSQMSGGGQGGGFNPMMLAQLMNSMNNGGGK